MKVDYSQLHLEESVSESMQGQLVKSDDTALPEFVKEVPSSKKSIYGSSVSISYSWKQNFGDFIKIKSIEYRDGEDLSDLYRINGKDGVDSIVLKHKSVSYILRKTTRDVANALYTSCEKLRAYLENVVGHIRTLLGHFYIISKISAPS